MIILHFDLQPQFKYMNYFIYTSHHFTPHGRICLALGAEDVLFDTNSTQIHSSDHSSALYTTSVSTDRSAMRFLPKE